MIRARCFFALMTTAIYATIQKIDAEERIVYGVASTETPDRQAGMFQGAYYAGDVIDSRAIQAALDDYMQWANVREMHQASAVGTAVAAEMRDGVLYLTAKIVDDGAWEKVKAGVYKGFSIGGRAIRAVIEKLADGTPIRRILEMLLVEISLVDRPANPDSRILLWKGDRMSKLQQAIAMLQECRNEAELAGNLTGADVFTKSIRLAHQAEAEVPETAVLLDLVKGVAGMLPESDETGRRIAKVLAGEWPAEATLEEVAVDVDAIGKAAGVAIGPRFDEMQTALANLSERLEKIEKQPTDGGPVLRWVQKQMAAGGAAAGGADAGELTPRQAARANDLRRLVATEVNSDLRAQYERELEKLLS